MHRCSESIGAIAAALARAQTELINPEKSLAATFDSQSSQGDRTFRYAPLSTGLDIVRKCLGRHEIAVVQSTAIDHLAELVRLNTLLAHASGEWLSSDWPVCAIAELASPHRLGAALTYARRYALFTMVGIAGEDDLDAPHSLAIEAIPSPSGDCRKQARGDGKDNSRPSGPLHNKRLLSVQPRPPVLNSEQSRALRTQLIIELANIDSTEELDAWAQRALRLKNTMIAEDAQIIEAEFRTRLMASPAARGVDRTEETTESINPLESAATSGLADAPTLSGSDQTVDRKSRTGECRKHYRKGSTTQKNGAASKAHDTSIDRPSVDKSILTLSEPRRYRDRAHLEFVASQPCLICERSPSDAHHIRFAQPSALGRRVSDEHTVPLCRTHHRALHRRGQEAEWWKENNIDPLLIASELWKQSRGIPKRYDRPFRSKK